VSDLRPAHEAGDPLWPLTGLEELLDAGYQLDALTSQVVLPMVRTFYDGREANIPDRWIAAAASV